MEQARRGSLLARMRGAALLDIPTYEEVEADRTATPQAALVVGLVAVTQAVTAPTLTAAAGAAAAIFVGWAPWSGITYLIGTWLGGTATWGELLRTIGFALTPGVLFLLGLVPVLGGLIVLIAVVWMLIAVIVGVRQALDVGTGRAILTAVLGFIPFLILMLAITALLNPRAL